VKKNAGARANLFGIAACSDGQTVWAVGFAGLILKSTDGGESWAQKDSGTQQPLYGVLATSDGRTLWAMREGGPILTSTDGGEHWTQTSGERDQNLKAVANVFTNQTLWTVADGGMIVNSANGGESLTQKSSETRHFLESGAASSDGRTLWVVGYGGAIMKSTDGGQHWAQKSSGTHQQLNGVAAISDGQTVWAVGLYGTILKSTDGGEHWNWQGYKRYPAHWLYLASALCLAGMTWGVWPIAVAPVQRIEELANSDAPAERLEDDLLGRAALVKRLSRFIRNPATAAPLVLSLQAPWGVGKTSVMKMLQNDLRRNSSAYTVWFNAWHHQTEDQGAERGTPGWKRGLACYLTVSVNRRSSGQVGGGHALLAPGIVSVQPRHRFRLNRILLRRHALK
jgi:photosystem II stability/assembly factor-like uncharacterized protein